MTRGRRRTARPAHEQGSDRMAQQHPLPGEDVSYWMRTAGAAPRPPLDGPLTVDVAVVGGGIAGLSTAWQLTRRGLVVAVLEADRVAGGVSGHTTAKVSALHSLVHSRVRRARGAEAGRVFAASQRDAVERLAATVADLGVECELERADAWSYAASPDSRDAVAEEARAAEEAGLPVEYLSAADLPFPVAGAVRLRDQLQFHPRKYLLALAERIEAGGGRVVEGCRVTGLHEGAPCRVDTADGAAVTARHVVVATHYPVFDRALDFARLSTRRELVVAAPVPADRAPAGMYITEDEGKRSVRTAPLDAGRRLLIVTGESFAPGTGDPRAAFHRLDRWMHDRFPVAGTAYRWAAQDNSPPDVVPLVGPFHPGARNTWVAAGFGGWGMTGGVLAGDLLASLIAPDGPPPAWAELYDPRRAGETLRQAPALLKQQASVAGHFVGDRVRAARQPDVADIPPGAGAVVPVGRRACAVHREEDGTLRALSARCTHLGCLVGWNAAERSWDCPCHGSRFGTDGRVLEGPAVAPLRAVALDGDEGDDGDDGDDGRDTHAGGDDGDDGGREVGGP